MGSSKTEKAFPKSSESVSRQERKRKRDKTVSDLPEPDAPPEESSETIHAEDADFANAGKRSKKRKMEKRTGNIVPAEREELPQRKSDRQSRREGQNSTPGGQADCKQFGMAEADREAEEASGKKHMKKKKKTKAQRDDGEAGTNGETAAAANSTSPPLEKSKRSKTSKSKRDAPGKDPAENSTKPRHQSVKADAENNGPSQKAPRFIVFIGNLPYTTTTDSLTAHFRTLLPFRTRHLTAKGTDRSKGYAFLEFDSYDRMETCLKMFHHSLFDDGVNGEVGKRRINVELTYVIFRLCLY